MEQKKTYSFEEMDCALCILDWFFTVEAEAGINWDEFGGFKQLREDIIKHLAPQIEEARVKAYQRLLKPARDAGYPICFDMGVIPEVLEEAVLPTATIFVMPQVYWDRLVLKAIWTGLEAFKAQTQSNLELSHDELEVAFYEAHKDET